MHFLTVAVLVLLLAPTAAWGQTDNPDVVYRYDLLTDQLVPVPHEELHAGCIYNHFDARLQRRVWSFLQSDGKFWHALGEGTTQEALRLDVQGTEQEREERLRQFRDLAQTYTMTGSKIFVRLTKEGRWVPAGVKLLATIYDAETGYRWDRASEKYIPVVHTYGRQWKVRNGTYQPAG